MYRKSRIQTCVDPTKILVVLSVCDGLRWYNGFGPKCDWRCIHQRRPTHDGRPSALAVASRMDVRGGCLSARQLLHGTPVINILRERHSLNEPMSQQVHDILACGWKLHFDLWYGCYGHQCRPTHEKQNIYDSQVKSCFLLFFKKKRQILKNKNRR